MSKVFSLLEELNTFVSDLVAQTVLRLNHALIWTRGFASVDKGL